MKILIYALQSSGASLFSYWLLQNKEYEGIIDLFVKEKAPKSKQVENPNVILKIVVSKHELQSQIKRFNPDKVILYLRDPYQNYKSLKDKHFEKKGGSIEDKFTILEKVFVENNFYDIIITYEDFLTHKQKVVKQLKAHGIPASMKNYKFQRTIEDICNDNNSSKDWISKYQGKKWGFGNIHKNQKLQELKVIKKRIPSDIKGKVQELCPNIVKFYAGKYK